MDDTPSEQWFAGRTAIVTGATGGIGRACTHTLAARGCTVYACDVADLESLEEAATYAAGATDGTETTDTTGANDRSGAIRTLEADVTDQQALESVVDSADDGTGIDILVNCAGIIDRSSIDDLEPKTWTDVLEVNLTGTYNAIRVATPALRNANAPGGAIVTVSSMLSAVGAPERAAYSASKGGLDSMTRSLAAELGADGIRVNAVNPGYVRTDMTRVHADSGREERYREQTAINRVGHPQDVAELVTFLASERARYISGQTIRIDGGQSAITGSSK
ncbi:SDR family oxidoreductase [Halobacteria archaeon AArc-curdl1]|uniref:SDR family oxidoreductase n=1 Tax=Natronosalvus hydrolyticus TaxID=2979988 RepID=A0AAP2Z664_9EURY|nr:SDR family oxidoreductase [Halobacteria archaeon AArc-curdl1]